VFPIGSSLAAAREARGLAVRDAERITCMRNRYLVALEEERWDDLPGRAYTRAFLRTYATALGLHADRFVAEFDEQHPEPVEDEPAPPRQRRPTIPFAFAPLAAVLTLVIVFVWAAWSSDELGHRTAAPPADAAHAAPPASHRPVVQVKAAHKTLARPKVLIVRAVSGPCWLEARIGGPTGSVIAERTLAAGQSIELGTKRVWLRLGAPWNVHVARGSHAVRLAGGTRPVDLTA
jgi:hypothetical protein